MPTTLSPYTSGLDKNRPTMPADPGDVPRARCGGVAPADRGGARRGAPELGRDRGALPAPCVGAAPAGHRARADRGVSRRQHPGAFRGALRRADDGGRAERDQHPARSGDDRLHPRPRRGACCSWTGSSPPRGGPSRCSRGQPLVIDIDDPSFEGGALTGEMDYEAFLARAIPRRPSPPADEWDPIALNYTSGTTGNPKGVVYHHRGAYLNAVSNALSWELGGRRSISGPCRCFTATAGAFPGRSRPSRGARLPAGGAGRARPGADPKRRGHAFLRCADRSQHDQQRRSDLREGINHPVKAMVGRRRAAGGGDRRHGADGLPVTHVYGLTECYGPTV